MGCTYIYMRASVYMYTYTSIASDAQSWVRALHIDPYTALLLCDALRSVDWVLIDRSIVLPPSILQMHIGASLQMCPLCICRR